MILTHNIKFIMALLSKSLQLILPLQNYGINMYTIHKKSHVHVACPRAVKLQFANPNNYVKKERNLISPLNAQTDNAPFQLIDSQAQKIQELADSLALPQDFLSQLPNDLRLDLNDAAFDLSNGALREECGEKLGEILMQLSQAWEQADTESATAIGTTLPSLLSFLSKQEKFALGKRLKRAGMRFTAMGQYGQGELQRVAKAMAEAGAALTAGFNEASFVREPVEKTKTLKFGSLQVELTSKKAYTGCVIALAFGALSWQLSAAVQNIPESSLQYANDNALVLAKSLRGALLAICYSSTVLSTATTIGLILLGRQLSSEGK